MKKPVRVHRDLEVYSKAFNAAMQIFECSKSFPKEETYSLTDQIRRSSRSVCANLAEAWRKRRYEKAFITSFPMLIARPLKLRYGWNSQEVATICNGMKR